MRVTAPRLVVYAMGFRRRVFIVLTVAAGVAALFSPAAPGPKAQGVCEDLVVDVRSLLILAEQGDKRAAYHLGRRAAAGCGGTRDDSEAVRWFRMAADKGLAEAQYNLGIMYAYGRGVERDMNQAARWYTLAAEQGIARAQFNLGTLYAAGLGVPEDAMLAAEWFRRAADSRLPQAQYNLGVLHEHGRGVRLDGRAALVWYKRAADQNFAPARERLDALKAKLRVSSVPVLPTPAPVRAPAPTVPEPEVVVDPFGWIATANPKYYTLQILSDKNEDSVRRFVLRHFEDDERAGYFASVKAGATWYAVVWGEFASYDHAKDAVAKLPPALRGAKPWARKIGIIQKMMIR